MSKLNGRKVAHLNALFSGTMVVGLGNLPMTVDSNLGGVVGGTELTLTEFGVHCKGKNKTGAKFEFVLPLSACKMVQLAPEEPSK